MNTAIITTTLIDIVLMYLLYSLQHFSFSIHVRMFSKGINSSAIIGTPIHELSHCLLCILFRHKIHKISLYSPSADGTLGSVIHSFNKKNLFETAGSCFIGIAPLFGGVLSIYLVNNTLFPGSNINNIFLSVSTIQLNGLTTISNCMLLTINELSRELLTFLTYDSFWRLVVWVYLSGSIALHMSPSRADLHNSITGIIAMVLILSVCYLLLPQLTLTFIFRLLSTLTIILIISLILAFITLIATLAVEVAVNAIRKCTTTH
ncbi:hypothetical protein [Photobacterium toruni]|uniref:hypothetical protein n=1 Tax=Photobacterium toruni TaxID=1935446 RepID=UPI00210F24A8|nr:hypothetical protein [Photobacterium toruni]